MFKEELTPRVQQLARYVQSLMRQENGKDSTCSIRKRLKGLPQEVFAIFYLLLQKGINRQKSCPIWIK